MLRQFFALAAAVAASDALADECVRVGPEPTPAQVMGESALVAEARITAIRLERDWFDAREPHAGESGIAVYEPYGIGCRERAFYTLELRRVWKSPSLDDVMLEIPGVWHAAWGSPFRVGETFFIVAHRGKDGQLTLDDGACAYLDPRDPTPFGTPLRIVSVLDQPGAQRILAERSTKKPPNSPIQPPVVDAPAANR